MKQQRDHGLDTFGFTHTPFCGPAETPYLDDSRQQILRKLERFVHHRGFTVVSGGPGCGKTSLLHHLVGQLHPSANKVIYMPFSVLSDSDMLRALCYEMELQPAMGKSTMLRNISSRIQDIQPVNPLLILDEIQKISYQTLEVIRLMANFSFDGRNFFSVIMAGTDQFLEQLRLRINEPLRQRITLYVRLTPFTRDDTEKYILHHIRSAGVHHDLITAQALNLVHDATAGIPRLINSVMLEALYAAAENNDKLLDIEHIQTALDLVTLPTREVQK
ncbi:AAA family ATPase [bacterium]|nr:AAA family ATPase [bacterium]